VKLRFLKINLRLGGGWSKSSRQLAIADLVNDNSVWMLEMSRLLPISEGTMVLTVLRHVTLFSTWRITHRETHVGSVGGVDINCYHVIETSLCDYTPNAKA
jgi:hypothetical protein